MSAPSAKRTSHPMYTLGPFNIVEETDCILREQSIFGQFNYLTSIIVPDEEDSNCDNSLIIDLSGYGSKNNVLQVNNVYFLLGRLVKTKEYKPGYTLFYEHSSAFHMGDCQAFYAQGISRLKGKVAVFGFGIVVHKEEVKVPGPNNGTQTNLHVTLRHHDYQNLVRQNVLLISIIGVADFFFSPSYLTC
jgi:hypothetical protein